MKTYINSRFFRQSILAFTGAPLFIWAMGSFPERSLLKESLSLITIIAFCQMIGQFFWARTNGFAITVLKMNKVVKYHKIIGYTFVLILLFHPIYLVAPRFFESGVSPTDAFMTIISTLGQGIVLGIIAWCLMLILGITTLVRKKLPMKYTTWRVLHGILAMLFIIVAAWHAMDLGRHFNLAMSILISLLSAGGFFSYLKPTLLKIKENQGDINNED